MVINLGFTKAGSRRGAKELVRLAEPFLVPLVRKLIMPLSPEAPLINMSGQMFRKHFSTALADLGLASLKMRPYSMRRGGASHHFILHKDIQSTLFLGRWDSVKTGRIYIQEGAAELASVAPQPGAKETCHKLFSLMSHCLNR